MNCPKCGAPTPRSKDETTTCFYCGAEVPPIQSAAKSDFSPPAATVRRAASGGAAAKRVSLLVGASGAIVLSVGIGFVVLKGSSDEGAADELAVAAQASSSAKPLWQGEEPLRCTGEEVVKLVGATIDEAADHFIRASGSCHVTLENCTIASTGIAIRLDDSATLTMTGGRVEAARTAVRADGSATISLTNATVVAKGGYALSLMGKSHAKVEGGSVTSDGDALRVYDGEATLTKMAIGGIRLDQGTVTLVGVSVDGSIRGMGSSRLKATGGRITSRGDTSLRTDGEARAELKDMALVGGVEARDTSRIQLEGGSVVGRARQLGPGRRVGGEALRGYNSGAVTFRGTELTGGTRSHGGAVILELARGDDADQLLDAASAEAAKMARYERAACGGFVACYTDNSASGAVDVLVEMPIGENGRAVRPMVRKATAANGAARACLQKVAREKRLDPFDGPPGKLVCKFSGKIAKGMQMLSVAGSFVPDDDE